MGTESVKINYLQNSKKCFLDVEHRAASTPFDLLHMCVIFTSCKACTRQLVRPFCLTEAVCFFFFLLQAIVG